MLLGYNSPDWVLALMAIWSLGAVPVLGNRWWSRPEAAHWHGRGRLRAP